MPPASSQPQEAAAEVVAQILAEISAHYPRGRLALAVDGAPGSGAADIAERIAAAYTAAGRPARAVALAGPEAGSAQALAAFDEAAFRREILDPFRAVAPADAVLVATGPFLLEERLRGIWHFSVYVDAPQARTEEAYLVRATPFFSASLVIDTGSPVPRRIFSDSC